MSVTTAPREQMGTFSLLIVDDDEQVLNVLARLLAEEGYHISTASDPLTALNLLRASPFDLLITDYQMPEMTGLELIRDARQLYPDLAAILITGFAMPDATVEAAEPGAYDVMFKPLKLAEVRLRIRNALDRLRLQREVQTYRSALEQARGDAGIQAEAERTQVPEPRPEFFPPGPFPPRRPPNGEAVLDQLERLAKLYQMGLVTLEEFEQLKVKLLKRL